MNAAARIVSDPEICHGRPRIAGTRMRVVDVLDGLAAGQTLTQSYRISIGDGRGGSVEQVVSVVIAGTNDAPVAIDDAATVLEDGSILIDVLLDHADVPGGVDTAWQRKQFLGAPAPGATFATLNLAQVVMVIEFTAAEFAETANDADIPASDAVLAELSVITDAVAADGTERVA